ncbi:MAG TPA: hypothetical protein VF633_01410, partial [Brevundimonas sp.]
MNTEKDTRPSDTEAAHLPQNGNADGPARIDQNFVHEIEGAERRERTGEPGIHGGVAGPAAGPEVADRL